MSGFNQLSSPTGAYPSTLEALQNSSKLLSCTLDLINAPSELRGFEAQRFSNQLLLEMRSHRIDPTREKVREYINAGVQLLNETIENKNFFNPDLQRECETALASTIGKFELFFFETANNGNLTTESLIEEIDVLKSLFPNANENSLRSNLLPSSLYSPEVYCKLDRISKFLAADQNEDSLVGLEFEIRAAFNGNAAPIPSESNEETISDDETIYKWIQSLN